MKSKLLYCIIFFALTLIPVYTMFFLTDKDISEKQDLAQMPSLFQEDGSFNVDFPSLFEKYLSDNFSFREDVISTYGKVKYQVFNVSAEEQVIAGDDGWLYFSKTLDDYKGENQLTEYELDALCKTVDLIDEYTESQGADFVFMIAPNKNSVYPQNMPYYYTPAQGDTNLEKINKALENKDYYLDVKASLDLSQGQVYHKTDTHWNNLGAAQCYNAMMDGLPLPHTDYIQGGYKEENNWQGDLITMMLPNEETYDIQIVFNTPIEYEYISKFRTEEDLLIETYNQDGSGNILVYRDSFCNALLPLIANDFQYCKFSRVIPYRISTEFSKQQYDVVVIEIVERNVSELLKGAPMITAPTRTLSSDVQEIKASEEHTKKSIGAQHIYGSFESETIPKAIYVQCGDTVYEAFPICETELMGESEAGKYYYSLYVPADADISSTQLYIK